jgi:hypothetical protein
MTAQGTLIDVIKVDRLFKLPLQGWFCRKLFQHSECRLSSDCLNTCCSFFQFFSCTHPVCCSIEPCKVAQGFDKSGILRADRVFQDCKCTSMKGWRKSLSRKAS